MLALIMAGGLGTRMNLGEKPLVEIAGKPMLSYVISAFERAGYEILVVATKKVPMTKNWCRANGIEIYQTSGTGYVEDLMECIIDIGQSLPFFTCVSDLPGITPDIIENISCLYEKSKLPACSVWVPENLFNQNNCKCNYHEIINNTLCCPVGLNILDGAAISSKQEELKVVLTEPALTFNVNTREELRRAEIYFNNPL